MGDTDGLIDGEPVAETVGLAVGESLADGVAEAPVGESVADAVGADVHNRQAALPIAGVRPA
ncbi:MAG TPA: hypothetical protein VHD81_02650 [Mycobacteriales bacterium]|nr:hypothetical protein [Mycobacteriales bacterium]